MQTITAWFPGLQWDALSTNMQAAMFGMWLVAGIVALKLVRPTWRAARAAVRALALHGALLERILLASPFAVACHTLEHVTFEEMLASGERYLTRMDTDMATGVIVLADAGRGGPTPEQAAEWFERALALLREGKAPITHPYAECSSVLLLKQATMAWGLVALVLNGLGLDPLVLVGAMVVFVAMADLVGKAVVGRFVFTWDPERFKDLRFRVEEVHDKGILLRVVCEQATRTSAA